MMTQHQTTSPDGRPLRVGILGTPVCSGNRGVLALAESLICLWRESSPGAEVSLFGSGRDGSNVTLRPEGPPLAVSLVKWRLSPSGGLRDNLFWIVAMSILYRLLPVPALRRRISHRTPWIGALESMDVVGDVRGGDSFSDIYGLKRFLIASLPVWTVIAIKGSIVQFPQTYGPYKSRISRVIARYLLRRSAPVIARDTRSQRVAQELLGPAGEVGLSPDVAFALHVRSPEGGVTTEPPLTDGVAPGTVGINVNGLMYHGGYHGSDMFGLKLDYPEFVRRLIGSLLEEHPGEVLLIPHTFAPAGNPESDNQACVSVRDSLTPAQRERVRVVVGDYDPHEIKSVIGQCDFFVGSRMHSCIAGLSQGVPTAAVAYSMKFAGVFESVGLGEWVVEARECDIPEAIEIVLDRFRQRDQVRRDLGRQAADARERLRAIFSDLATRAAATAFAGQAATEGGPQPGFEPAG